MLKYLLLEFAGVALPGISAVAFKRQEFNTRDTLALIGSTFVAAVLAALFCWIGDPPVSAPFAWIAFDVAFLSTLVLGGCYAIGRSDTFRGLVAFVPFALFGVYGATLTKENFTLAILGVLLPLAIRLSIAKLRGNAANAELVAASLVAIPVGTLIADGFGYFDLPPMVAPYGNLLFDAAFTAVVVLGICELFLANIEIDGGNVASALTPAIIFFTYALGMGIIALPIFNADYRASVIGNVVEYTETNELGLNIKSENVLSPDHPLIVTEAQAVKHASVKSDELGALGNLLDLNHLTLAEDYRWYVFPEVDNGDLFNWVRLFRQGGVPGWISVDADNPDVGAAVTHLPEGEGIQYTPHSHFSYNSYRSLRAAGLNEQVYYTRFHVNETNGRPEIVMTTGAPTRGFGVIVMHHVAVQDAITGKFEIYEYGQQPDEYEMVTPRFYAERLVNDWGRYREGYIHQAGPGTNILQVATDGILGGSEISAQVGYDGRLKWYIPVQYQNRQGSIDGFMLMDMGHATVEYFVETAANPAQVRAALNAVQEARAAGFEASEPRLYSVYNGKLKVWIAPYEVPASPGKNIVGYGATDHLANEFTIGSTKDEAVRKLRASLLKQSKFQAALATANEQVFTVEAMDHRLGDVPYFVFKMREVPLVVTADEHLVPYFIHEGSRVKVTYLQIEGTSANTPVQATAIELLD